MASIHDGWTPQPEDEEAAYYEAHRVEWERDEWKARAEAAEQDAAECRAERAHYGDLVTAELGALEAECERLRAALADIVEDTDADNPNSYRSDDREGCLDWVYAKAAAALDN